jgi:hypothetical protein
MIYLWKAEKKAIGTKAKGGELFSCAVVGDHFHHQLGLLYIIS